MKTLVFAIAGYNLAETGRHIEIAKGGMGLFQFIFISYGGNFVRQMLQISFMNILESEREIILFLHEF